MVPVGGTVSVGPPHGTLVYRAVLNPRPAQFGIAPAYLASAYRPTAPTSELLRRPRNNPAREPQLRVPDTTPPGVYLMLLWDGEEGGAHNTWDYIHIFDASGTTTRPETAKPREPNRSGHSRVPVVVAAGLGFLAGAVAAALASSRRRRRSAAA